MNRTQTTLDIPETTFILTHPVLNGSVSADINWLAGSRGSITLSFCGVDVLDDDDCKTVPTPVQILAMRSEAGDGEVQARSIYRFKARRINVTHGLCDAERPDKAPHGLMLKFNVRGNRPESDKLLPLEQQVAMPDQLQPVIMVSMRYPQLWDAAAASRNTTMVMATQKTSAQPRLFEEVFDIVHRFDTLSPENPNLHCVLHVGIKHTPQSLLSEAAAKHLDKRYGMSFADISARLMALSKARVLECQRFFEQLTDKQTAESCRITQMTLKIGTGLGIEQLDWSQWAEAVRIQGGILAEAHMQVLISAILDVAQVIAVAHRDPRLTSTVTPQEITAALTVRSSAEVSEMVKAQVALLVATQGKYAYDAQVNIEVPVLLGRDIMQGVETTSAAGGENQNIGGLVPADNAIVNARQQMPLLRQYEAKLASLAGNCDAAHTHPEYLKLGTEVRRAMRTLNTEKQLLTVGTGDCEDVASKTALTYNAAKVMSLDHHAFVAHDKIASDHTCTCRLHSALDVYAKAVPLDAEFMPCVAAIVHLVAGHRDLGIGLVFASGANRDAASAVVSAPKSVGGAHGIFPTLEEGLRLKVDCGHAVPIDLQCENLHTGHAGHGVLASLQAQGLCTRLRLSQIKTGMRFFEATGPTTQLSDTWNMSNKVDLSFKPVPDAILQGKLDMLSAASMPEYKATNLIAALHTQSLYAMGLESTIQQKFTLNDASCFYQNVISYGDAIALTTGLDGGSTMQVAPTAYIPQVLDSAAAPVTRMLVHSPCDQEEKTLITMLWRARIALNPTLQSIMANAQAVGTSTPPMSLRGRHVLRNQTGEMSTVVFKSGCYPGDKSWTWQKETDARMGIIASQGYSSCENIDSQTWLAHFHTNPCPQAG